MHLDLPPALIPDKEALSEIDLADVALERILDAPADARAFCGARWRTGAVAALRDPPGSRNLRFNPAHPEGLMARIVALPPFLFDRRLWSPP